MHVSHSFKCAVQARRNGIRVGDLVNDFDVFTQKYVRNLALFPSIVIGWLVMIDVHDTHIWSWIFAEPAFKH